MPPHNPLSSFSTSFLTNAEFQALSKDVHEAYETASKAAKAVATDCPSLETIQKVLAHVAEVADRLETKAMDQDKIIKSMNETITAMSAEMKAPFTILKSNSGFAAAIITFVIFLCTLGYLADQKTGFITKMQELWKKYRNRKEKKEKTKEVKEAKGKGKATEAQVKEAVQDEKKASDEFADAAKKVIKETEEHPEDRLLMAGTDIVTKKMAKDEPGLADTHDAITQAKAKHT